MKYEQIWFVILNIASGGGLYLEGGTKWLFSKNWCFYGIMAFFWKIGIFGWFSCVLVLREATQNIQRVKGDFQTFFVCGGGGGPFDQTWGWGMNLK